MRFLLISFFFGCLLLSCKAPRSLQNTPDTISDTELLKSIMTGSFNSSVQAAADSSYYDITMHLYPVWKSKKGHWMYIEQAVSSNQKKPYRQRFYKLEKVNSQEFISRVYTLDSPEKYIGKWKEPAFFDQFDESIITEKVGCEVYLTKQADGSYSGGTQGTNCKSKMRGAAYATSKVTVSSKSITSWDRGFDKNGKYVWGAEEGGYIFKN